MTFAKCSRASRVDPPLARLLGQPEVPGHARAEDLSVVSVAPPDVLGVRREDIDRPCVEREAPRQLHPTHLPNLFRRGPTLGRVDLAREWERVSGHRPEPHAAVRVMPQPGRVEMEAAVDAVAHSREDVAAVDRDVIEGLLDERIRVAALEAHLGQDAREAEPRRYADLQRLWAGKLAFWNADWKQAETDLTAAVERLPNSTDAWLFLGETRRRLKKPDAARDAYQRCLSLDPRQGSALRGLAILDGRP